MLNKRGTLASVFVAAILTGLLAGGNVDRALVAMPAWRITGPVAWADFSRYADLGNGLLVYPVMAIGGTLFSIAAVLLFLWAKREPRTAALPILIAAALMIVALPISLKATPFMLSLRHIGDSDVEGLRQAFAGFEFWGRLQGVLHVGAFIADLWALLAIGQEKAGVIKAETSR